METQCRRRRINPGSRKRIIIWRNRSWSIVMFRPGLAWKPWLWPGFRWLWLSESVGRAKAVSDGSALAWPGLSRGPSTGKYQTIYIVLRCAQRISAISRLLNRVRARCKLKHQSIGTSPPSQNLTLSHPHLLIETKPPSPLHHPWLLVRDCFNIVLVRFFFYRRWWSRFTEEKVVVKSTFNAWEGFNNVSFELIIALADGDTALREGSLTRDGCCHYGQIVPSDGSPHWAIPLCINLQQRTSQLQWTDELNILTPHHWTVVIPARGFASRVST